MEEIATQTQGFTPNLPNCVKLLTSPLANNMLNQQGYNTHMGKLRYRPVDHLNLDHNILK